MFGTLAAFAVRTALGIIIIKLKNLLRNCVISTRVSEVIEPPRVAV